MMMLVLGMLLGWLVTCVVLAIAEARPLCTSAVILDMPVESASQYSSISAMAPPLAS